MGRSGTDKTRKLSQIQNKNQLRSNSDEPRNYINKNKTPFYLNLSNTSGTQISHMESRECQNESHTGGILGGRKPEKHEVTVKVFPTSAPRKRNFSMTKFTS